MTKKILSLLLTLLFAFSSTVLIYAEESILPISRGQVIESGYTADGIYYEVILESYEIVKPSTIDRAVPYQEIYVNASVNYLVTKDNIYMDEYYIKNHYPLTHYYSAPHTTNYGHFTFSGYIDYVSFSIIGYPNSNQMTITIKYSGYVRSYEPF